jgi:lipid-binding SYLF domain-containing protein
VTESVESTRTDLRDEATPEGTRAKLDAMAEMTLDHLFSGWPSTRELFERSVGYAVFDTREASFYLVAGYGRGVAVDQRDDSRFYMKMAKTGAGLSLGIGGFDDQIVILFEDGATFESFLEKGSDAAAKGGTMIGEDRNEFMHQFSGGKAV